MSMRVRYRGLDVAVDSIEDLDAIADHLEFRTKLTEPFDGRLVPLTEPIEPERHLNLNEALASLKPAQMDLLATLSAHNGELHGGDIMHQLGLQTYRDVGGLVGAISKKLGDVMGKSVIINRAVFKNGRREWYYQLNPEVREEIITGLNELRPEIIPA